jgi:hypothetical protein
VKIEPSSQSLILAGESPEADLRFERALRLNGARESAKFTVQVPPALSELTDADKVAASGFLSVDPADSLRNPSSRPSKSSPAEPLHWEKLYRMVTQGESLPKGRTIDVLA